MKAMVRYRSRWIEMTLVAATQVSSGPFLRRLVLNDFGLF